MTLTVEGKSCGVSLVMLVADTRVFQGSPVRGSMLPGHAERQEGVVTLDPPHPLSEVEVKRLDEECYERFIKVNVKHITDGQVSWSRSCSVACWFTFKNCFI